MMVEPETLQWECVLDAKTGVGEKPVYAPEEDALYFTDLVGRTLNRLDLASRARRTWGFDTPVSTYALTPDRRHALVAAGDGLVWLHLESGTRTPLAKAAMDPAHYQLNDGRCDSAGRFWVGSLRKDALDSDDGNAGWHRCDETGFHEQFKGVTIANGCAWSPDDRTLYVSDRTHWRILAFDYDIATGQASNRRTFATVPEGETPDGAAVDTEGGYWIAMFRAGVLRRFRPDGTLDRIVRTPTALPTMMSFGGPDLDVAYLTTAIPRTGEAYPLAGAIFRARLGVRGLPEPRFSRLSPPI